MRKTLIAPHSRSGNTRRMAQQLAPALRPLKKNPAAYDLVVIVTPASFWSLSSPVRSRLERHPLRHSVAFFCTMGGSGAPRVLAAMRALFGRDPQAALALTDREIDAGHGKLDAFAHRLQRRLPRRPGRALNARPAHATG